jgi:hypothetical protein
LQKQLIKKKGQDRKKKATATCLAIHQIAPSQDEIANSANFNQSFWIYGRTLRLVAPDLVRDLVLSAQSQFTGLFTD